MKAFSLIEIIVVLLIVAIITTFAMTKFNQVTNKTHLVTLKSQLALIQSGISKQKNKNILLSNFPNISSLDDASTNVNNQELFKKVIDFSILSTNTSDRKLGSWAKVSQNSYIFYLESNPINFVLENNSFVCKSQEDICKELN
ncbi:type II secretion system protein [Aliarcobacter butzleri]|uniref:type II secretion system protein n=2 Tax=Aliarcobacter butzleri TaxID=28197 RepID=UPI001D1742D7|nr:type II secretion system protein [Aliarcobacter butzleri]MCT7624979.1 type II secretion system GspH family protein [Aliarcobacter butzleri]MCT7636657.1 type II secretion system GspH family protein [Aliarcobacter butzleri]MCT7643054.1 type II secretion system GspH family protein [Aliarcobacter butzleri]MCT7647457.1 type II secretion system GspH family protein [Aliarcobacter butzleri]MDK2046680.1 type II secretion system protein [Aliarcobacter butzleri]